MVKIKQAGKTLHVQVDGGQVFILNDLNKDEVRRIYKYGVLYNKNNANEYAKNRLLALVDLKTKAIKDTELELKIERKIQKRQLAEVHGSLSKYFTVRNGALQIKGIAIDFPLTYVDVLNNTVKKGYDPKAIKNFLQLLALNPSRHIRDNLFDFFVANHFPITESGYIVALRRVHTWSEKGKVNPLHVPKDDLKREKVLSAYNVVRLWKKNPDKYFLSEEGKPSKTPNGKTLSELKKEVESQVKEDIWYTDNFTKKFKWHLQTICDKPRGESVGYEDSNCSAGFFHLGSKDHVLQNTSYGNVILLCLVNPMNCTNIPRGQTWKFGTCEFFPVAEISEEEVEEIFKNPFDVVGTIDEIYERMDLGLPVGVEFSLTNNERIQAINKKLEELKKDAELYQTVTEFDELAKIVESRIVEI